MMNGNPSSPWHSVGNGDMDCRESFEECQKGVRVVSQQASIQVVADLNHSRTHPRTQCCKGSLSLNCLL